MSVLIEGSPVAMWASTNNGRWGKIIQHSSDVGLTECEQGARTGHKRYCSHSAARSQSSRLSGRVCVWYRSASMVGMATSSARTP